MSLVTKENKTNDELSKMFTVEKLPAQDDKDDNDPKDDKEEVKLKVINKDEEKQKDGKIKVTLTVNKELNADKLPKGWELSKDKKSISKVMKVGATEKIELVAIDGTELNYEVKVTADKGNEKLPTKLPQAGLGTTLTFAVVVVAGIALISLKKYRDYKDIK